MPVSLTSELMLAACMLVGAALYTSVGHAGASAYLALMALFGLPATVMRPTALFLNIIVALFASLRFAHAGLFRWRTLWPFLIGAIPFAVLGGSITVPSQAYRPLLGFVLLIAGVRLLWPGEAKAGSVWRDPPILPSVVSGAGIGLLSGLTGTGGGIFLSPLLVILAWSETKVASGVVAMFILANSAAGLLGNIASVQQLPSELPLFAGAVLIGAFIGTTLGIRLAQPTILRALGVVVLFAGAKLIGVH
jgi:hypothetical protein